MMFLVLDNVTSRNVD